MVISIVFRSLSHWVFNSLERIISIEKVITCPMFLFTSVEAPIYQTFGSLGQMERFSPSRFVNIGSI